MNQFAGSIICEGNVVMAFSEKTFLYVKNILKGENSEIYFYGETKFSSSEELVKYFEKTLGKILYYDISISTEDRIEILEAEQLDGEYSCMAITGESNDFLEILQSFEESENVVCVREAEEDNRYGNRVIKVDVIS